MKENELQKELNTFRMYGIAVPSHIHQGLINYIIHHRRPGSFLCAVMQNDLRKAVGYADLSNLHALNAITAFLYNHAPSESYGSPEAFENWLAN